MWFLLTVRHVLLSSISDDQVGGGWWHCSKVPIPVCNDIQYKSKLFRNAGEHWGFTESENEPESHCSLKCPYF